MSDLEQEKTVQSHWRLRAMLGVYPRKAWTFDQFLVCMENKLALVLEQNAKLSEKNH